MLAYLHVSLFNISVLSSSMLSHRRCFCCHWFHFCIFWVYVCVCSAFHVQAHHCHSPGLMEVLENEVNTFFLLLLLPVVQLLFLSALSSPLWSLSPVFLFLFFSSFLLSFFPPITELGPGCLDQCHHSGWQRGRAQRFPRWLNGLCGCLSSF